LDGGFSGFEVQVANRQRNITIRELVIEAREIQMKRLTGRRRMYCIADMQSKDTQSFCKLDAAAEELLTWIRLPGTYQRSDIVHEFG